MSTELVICHVDCRAMFSMCQTGGKTNVNKISVGPESLDGYATYVHTETDQSKKFTFDHI